MTHAQSTHTHTTKTHARGRTHTHIEYIPARRHSSAKRGQLPPRAPDPATPRPSPAALVPPPHCRQAIPERRRDVISRCGAAWRVRLGRRASFARRFARRFAPLWPRPSGRLSMRVGAWTHTYTPRRLDTHARAGAWTHMAEAESTLCSLPTLSPTVPVPRGQLWPTGSVGRGAQGQ